MDDRRSEITARLRAALGPPLEEDGFREAPEAAAPGRLVWEKPGDLAPAGEVDRVTFEVDPAATLLTGAAASWMGPATNIRALCLSHREAAEEGPAPAGWPVGGDAALDATVAEIAGLVVGQLIGWLDEPVPLARPKLRGAGLGLELGALTVPGRGLPAGDAEE